MAVWTQLTLGGGALAASNCYGERNRRYIESGLKVEDARPRGQMSTDNMEREREERGEERKPPTLLTRLVVF